MIFESKNFMNNIYSEIENFLTVKQGTNDDFYDVYCGLDYNDLDKTMYHIEKRDLEDKPFVTIIESNPVSSHQINDNSVIGNVEKISMDYTLYISINETYKANLKRKQLLNQLVSEVKYKFDNYKSKLPYFRQINISYSRGILKRDADNIYSSRMDVSFEVFKKIS